MKIIVGLGNPGKKYDKTRHNVGYQFLEALIDHWNMPRDVFTKKFEAVCYETEREGQKILLLAPTTFMNLSGRSVRAASVFYKIPPADILVVCDDLNLPCGKLRLRAEGSAGGQKGLQNIIDQLATQAVPRLRIGIDRPPENFDTVNYVLGRFSQKEAGFIEDSLPAAISAVNLWIREGLGPAMNQVNAPPKA